MKKWFLLILIVLTVIISGCKKKEVLELKHNIPDELYLDETIKLNFNQEVTINNLTPDIIDIKDNNLIPLKKGIGSLEVAYGNKKETIEILISPLNKPLYAKMVIDEEHLLTDQTYSFKMDYGIDHVEVGQIKISSQSPEVEVDLEKQTIKFTAGGVFSVNYYLDDDSGISDSSSFDVHYGPDYEGFTLLFVGNSLTKYTYDIPKMLGSLMEEGNVKHLIITDSKLSTYLIEHEESFNKNIERYYYTHVILQERSNGPINEYEKFENAVTLFEEKIKANGADLVLYETWGYDYPSQEAKDSMRDSLFSAYEKCAKDHNALLVKSGESFRLFESLNSEVSLYAENDQNHPSLVGAFLSSCTFYTTLIGKSASSLTYRPEGMSEEVAKLVKQVADQIGLN